MEYSTITQRLYDLLYINRIHFLTPIEKLYIARCMDEKNKAHAHSLCLQDIMNFSIDRWKMLLHRNVREESWGIGRKNKAYLGMLSDVKWLEDKRGQVCTIDDAEYPTLLRNIYDPPIVLFYKGNSISALERKSISIVGTRSPSTRGRAYARKLGEYYIKNGYNVVSGLAYGIDVEAHRGLLTQTMDLRLEYGIPVVVLGTSIDRIYPKPHLSIASHILSKKGIILSEISPNQNTYKFQFLARNRIISGLSMDLIIVQAPARSGALATAEFALEQGRNIWVHRVGVCNQFSGTRQLAGQGAKIIQDQGSEVIHDVL